jgi:XisI protein
MERITFFQKKIHEAIEEYLIELRQPINNDIEFFPIIDINKNHFQIIAMGWEGYKRIFNLLFHLDIIGDKIWVQEDKMEHSIAERLVEKGISKKEIVLAYFPDYHRAYTEYAVS